MPQNNVVDHTPRIVAFGELLWDMLPDGPRLGGAPVNFLYHAAVLGARVQALTRVGNDRLGREIVARLKELRIPTDFVQISSDAPTGVVDVALDQNGIPAYKIVEGVAWDDIRVDAKVANEARSFLDGSDRSAFYFGSLALRSPNNRASLERVLDAIPSRVLRVCDLNVRLPFYTEEVASFSLHSADVFKLNDLEAVMIDSLFNGSSSAALASFADKEGGLGAALRTEKKKMDVVLKRWSENLRERFAIKTVILTCGAVGAYVFNAGRAAFAPSKRVKITDTVGAGDSFSAVCVVGLLEGIDDQIILEAASSRAAYVCTQSGGTPLIPPEKANPFNEES